MNKHVYVDLLRQSLEKHGKRECLHIKRNGAYTEWSYADFQRDLNRLTGVLSRQGVCRDVNCAVIGENSPEWVIAYHAIILAGGCTVPIDPNLPGDEIREILHQSQPKIVFCSPSFVSVIQSGQAATPAIETIVVLDAASDCGELNFYRYIETADPAINAFGRAFQPEDPMVIIFTSGTTGKAKGVVLMQKNFTAASLHAAPRMGLDANNTMLAILPLHHVFGFAACVAATLTSGMSIVFVPVIKGPLILEALVDKKVSVLPAVPKLLTVLYDGIWRKVHGRGPLVRLIFNLLMQLSRLVGPFLGQAFRKKLFKSVHDGFGGNVRLIVSGGAALGKKYFDGFRCMGFDIVEGYGLTETFGPITCCPSSRPLQGSVGPVLPENEVRIADPDEHGIGEVLLRGTTVFAGYYRNEAATAAVFDKQGWFHTGDLGRLTKDKYLVLSGRSKDVIVLESGKNVFPDELEEYYESSPLIEEIGVFGFAIKGKEIAAALIVPNADIRKTYKIEKATELIHNEVIRLGRNRPSYKKITDYAVVFQPLPRTTTRKLKKPLLVSMYRELLGAPKKTHVGEIRLSALDEALMSSPEFRRLVARLKKIKPSIAHTRITPHSNLEIDLEFDSLLQLDVYCGLEQEFAISFPEAAMTRVETVGDLYAKLMEIVESAKTQPPPSQPADIRKRLAQATEKRIEARDNRSPIFRLAPAALNGLSQRLWRVEICGAESIPARSPVIFAANHQSMLDAVWILGSLPWHVRRRTFSIGKRELVRNPLAAAMLRQCNFIDIERGGDAVESIAAALAVLKKGKNLIIFPEGTRSSDATVNPFKAGIGMLMLETNVPVVPIRISGATHLWPARTTSTSRHAPARVSFGTPLTLQSLIEQGRVTPYDPAGTIAAAMREIIAGME